MAKRSLQNPQGLPTIYGKRQPTRPHHLRDWIEKRQFRTDAEFAEAVGADKSVVSRWLDESDPTTPGRDWQARLGVFFGSEDDPADIFRHPDDDWMARFLRRKDIDPAQVRLVLEAAFPKKNRNP